MPETYDCIKRLHGVRRWRERDEKRNLEKLWFSSLHRSDDIDLSQRRVRVEEGTYKLSFRWRKVSFSLHQFLRRWGGRKNVIKEILCGISKSRRRKNLNICEHHQPTQEKSSRSLSPFFLHLRPYRKNIKHKIRSL